MAINASHLTDEDSESSDWIEIHNPSANLFDLAGFFLSDDADQLDRWKFPSVDLQPGEYLIVFASGKDRAVSGSELHTNFRLSGSGEYLTLIDPDGTRVSEYSPEFPAQRSDISFGIAGISSPLAGQMVYFTEPTPGEENLSGTLGFVEDPSFDIPHGIYNDPIDVSMTTDTPDATIRYTLDGSLPTMEDGFDYSGPIPITTTTTLRAVAFKDDYLPSGTHTQTYIFPDDVIRQPALPEGFPSEWGTHTDWYDRTKTYPTEAEYEMDQGIVDDPRYADEMIDALTAIPSVSLVMNVDDLFGPDGIYRTPGKRDTPTRLASIELIEPGDAGGNAGGNAGGGEGGFQIDAGIRMHGGWSRSPYWTPKHSFRVLFKSEFGPSKLEYPLFGDDATDRFDQLILRAGFQDSWQSASRSLGFEDRAVLIRDEMVRRTSLAIDQPDPHGRFVHLYVNGLYWGIYNVVERPNESFGEAYWGGAKDDYDTFNQGKLTSGDDVAWQEMFNLANNGDPSISLFQWSAPSAGELSIKATLQGSPGEFTYKSNALVIFDYKSPRNFKFAGAFFGASRWRIGRFDDSTWTFNAQAPGPIAHTDYDVELKLEDTRATLYVNGTKKLTYDFSASLTDGQFGLGTQYAIAQYDNVHVPEVDTDQGRYSEDFEDGTADLLEPVSGYWHVTDGRYEVIPGLGSSERYNDIQQYLDVPNLVNHMLVNYYFSSFDWPHKGFWALREREPGVGFKFVSWDVEISMRNLGDSRTSVDVDNSPGRLLAKLRTNAEFRLFFADQVQRHLFNNGALTPENNQARFQQLADGLNTAILAESARWGQGFLNRDDHWLPEIDFLLDKYFVKRHDIALRQYRDVDLFPPIDVSIFNQHGGQVAADFELQITNPNSKGTIYYRSDGGDPRETGGAVSDSAIAYTGPITLAEDITIKARVRDGSTWSAINEGDFLVDHVAANADNLVVTELNYHPHAANLALGELDEDANEFEFIELLNFGSTTIDLLDVQFSDGIAFNFNHGMVASLAPGERVLVVENQAAFESRYGTDLKVTGQYSGRLSNGGETIRLEDSENTVIVEFTYDNAGDWPLGADGQGSSLEIVDPGGDHNDAANWRASTEHGGSPGTAGIGATAAVVGRHIFYNRSNFDGEDASANANDDDAIAPDKMALLPGQTASFQNYTSYSRGINGIMVDIANLADAGAINAVEFEFRVGNNDDPSTWSTMVAAPLEVSVRQGAGIDGSDRVTIIWDDHAIEKEWMRVTVLPTPNTGLSSPDVHYWGNAVGDSGDSAINAHVTATDELTARFNPHSFIDPALIDDVADYDRDRFVNTTDELTARFNATGLVTALPLITAPAAGTIPNVHLQRPSSSISQALALLTRSLRNPERNLGTPRPTWFRTEPSAFVLDRLVEDDRVDLLALQLIDKPRADYPFYRKLEH